MTERQDGNYSLSGSDHVPRLRRVAPPDLEGTGGSRPRAYLPGCPIGLLIPTAIASLDARPQSWHQVTIEIGAVVWCFTVVVFAAICAVVRFAFGGEFLGAPAWAWGLASTVGVLAGVVAIEGK